MSDDNNNLNSGITLPDGKNSTHNIGLSPLFMNRTGRGTHSYSPQYAIEWRGDEGYLWSTTAYNRSDHWAYYLKTKANVAPSDHYSQSWVESLRCLVSTNNKIMTRQENIFLVSDDISSDVAHANGGVTLPGDTNATHSISLTPLFFSRNGRGGYKYDELAIIWYGRIGYYWTQAVYDHLGSYRMTINDPVYPSSIENNTYAHSIRCLVSTNNR